MNQPRTYTLAELAKAAELEKDDWARDLYLRSLDIHPIPGTEPSAYTKADVERLRDAMMTDLRERFDRVIPRGFRFECGRGWRAILERFFETVERELPAGVKFDLRQIKEKFGDLRIYYRLPEDVLAEVSTAIGDAVDLAEARAHYTCEQCGQPGAMRNDSSWFFVACDKHAISSKGKAVPPSPDSGYIRHKDDGWVRYDPDSDAFVPSADPKSLHEEE